MKNNRKLAALILAAAMTVTTPYTAWGADAFSAGESFGDGTESIPGILTSMLDYGQVGKEYKVQLQAESMQRDSRLIGIFLFRIQAQKHSMWVSFRRAGILIFPMHMWMRIRRSPKEPM